MYHTSVKKLHENTDLENKKESLRLLFYKIPEFISVYEEMQNNKKIQQQEPVTVDF